MDYILCFLVTLFKVKITFFYSSGENTPIKFGKKRKIPLLSEVIEATKDDELVMYLNVSEFHYGQFLFSSLVITHE